MITKNFEKGTGGSDNLDIDIDIDIIEKISEIIAQEVGPKESRFIQQIKKYNRRQKFLEEEIKTLEKQVKNQTPKCQIKVQTAELKINETNKLIKINLQEAIIPQISKLKAQQKENNKQMASGFINFFDKKNIDIEQLGEKPLEALLKELSFSNPTIIVELIKKAETKK